MSYTLQELADLLGAEIRGDAGTLIHRVATIDQAGEGDITFIANPRYRRKLPETKASAVIVSPDVPAEGRTLLVTDNPYLAFARAVDLFHPEGGAAEAGVHEGARVDPSARLGEGVTVYAGAYVGREAVLGSGVVLHPGAYVGAGVRIGAGCVLHANAVVYPDTEIGEGVILHGGAVIGSDGFGFAPAGAQNVKIRQVGRVVIEDDVELGANCSVDRAVLGETRIGRGTKIDNLVQIGHNVTIGEDCIIVAQVGISGSSRIGDRVKLAGQVGVGGHIHIGDDAEVGAKSGVMDEVPPSAKVLGQPAIPLREGKKALATIRMLPAMRKEIRELRGQIKSLETRLGVSDDGE